MKPFKQFWGGQEVATAVAVWHVVPVKAAGQLHEHVVELKVPPFWHVRIELHEGLTVWHVVPVKSAGQLHKHVVKLKVPPFWHARIEVHEGLTIWHAVPVKDAGQLQEHVVELKVPPRLTCQNWITRSKCLTNCSNKVSGTVASARGFIKESTVKVWVYTTCACSWLAHGWTENGNWWKWTKGRCKNCATFCWLTWWWAVCSFTISSFNKSEMV